MKRITLALVDRLCGPIAALGIDVPRYRLVLETKLELDNRRPQSVLGMGGQESAEAKAKRLRGMAMAFHVFMGGMLAMGCASLPPFAGMSIFHGFLAVMLAMTLLAEFTTILHDPADSSVLRPLPLDARTILAARLTHAGVFIASTTLCLSAGAVLIGPLRGSWLYVPAFLVSILENALFVVALVHFVHLLVMRFASPKRFRDAVNIVQVALSIVFSVSYVILPRLFDVMEDGVKTVGTPVWLYALPSSWFASVPALALGAPAEPILWLAGVGALTPLAGIVVVLRALAPAYRRALALGATGAASAHRGSRARRAPLVDRLARRLLSGGVAAAFSTLSRLVVRDRSFRLRMLPTIAVYMIFLGLQPILTELDGKDGLLASLREGRAFLSFLYCAIFAGAMVVTDMARSESSSAAWVWRALPFARPGEIFMGAVLAVARRIALPLLAFAAGMTLAIWGAPTIPDVVFAAAVLPLAIGALVSVASSKLPFSEPLRQQAASAPVMVIGCMLLVGALCAFHWLIDSFWPSLLLPLAAGPLALGVTVLRRVARTSWTSLGA